MDEGPRSAATSGAEARTSYRGQLALTLAVAGMSGVVGAALTVRVLRVTRVLCEDGFCPDGVAYLLPTMAGGVAVAALVLAIGVLLIVRGLETRTCSALAVDLARLAAVPMLLVGGLALAWFVRSGFSPMLGYGAALLVGGLVPVLARRGGRSAFVVTTAGFAALALLVAIPAILVAPLLAGYAALLVLAALVASRAPSEARPYGAAGPDFVREGSVTPRR